MSIPTPENLEHLINFTPEAQADVLAKQQDIQQIKDLYLTIIARLQQIEDAANPTNAQVIAAVRDIARYERYIFKVLKRMI